MHAALLLMQAMQVAQRREVLERETDRIENRDFAIAARARAPAPRTTSLNSMTGNVGSSCWISPSMRDCGSYSTTTRASGLTQDVGVQLGLARAIAADRVQMHAGLDHLGRQDRGVALVGGDGRDDVGAARSFG